MSFILDALKKSESERQRQDTPGIANIPERAPASTSNRWIWVVGALLTFNLLALSGFMLWKNRAVTEVAVTDVAVPIDLPGQENTAASFSELVSEVKRNQPGSMMTDQGPASASEPGAQPAPQTETVVNIDSVQASAEPEPGTVSDGLETFNNLRAKGVLQLPDMHLDIHVFSGEPADRFVFVNMSKYKENAVLSEGPQVKEITAEGVVLEHQNTTFLLPRE